jgi:hypothetical protein
MFWTVDSSRNTETTGNNAVSGRVEASHNAWRNPRLAASRLPLNDSKKSSNSSTKNATVRSPTASPITSMVGYPPASS